MAEQWWMVKNPDGSCRQVVTDGRLPSKCGEEGEAVKISNRSDPNFQVPDWKTKKWVIDLDRLKAHLISTIERERQIRQDRLVSPGDGKKIVYAQKNAEQVDYFSNSDVPADADRFPAAFAEIAATGDSIDNVMQRYRTGANTANRELYRLDAVALKAKMAVKASNTEEAAKAAADVIW